MALGGRMTHAPGIPRLGIDPYPWGSECLRGDVRAGPATSFPQAIGLAAIFRYCNSTSCCYCFIFYMFTNFTNEKEEQTHGLAKIKGS